MGKIIVPVEKRVLHLQLPLPWLRLEVSAFINGKPIKLENFHASITSNGFSHIGNSFFNSSHSLYDIHYIWYELSTGDVVSGTTSYYYTVDNQHRHYSRLSPGIGGDWTASKLLTASTTTPAANQIIAEASWSAVSYIGSDNLDVYWDFRQATAGSGTWSNWQKLGELAFKPGNLQPFFEYMTLIKDDDSEFMREQATYTENSSTEHELENVFTPGSTVSNVRKVRIYDAASAGNYCYEYNFGENKTATSGTNVTVTITTTLS